MKLRTDAARTAVRAQQVDAKTAQKIEELASASTAEVASGAPVDTLDAARSFTKANKLEGAERELFHAAFKELAQKAGSALAALADAADSAPAGGPPSLFSDSELDVWRTRIGEPLDAKRYDEASAKRDVFVALRLKRASAHPRPVADALLVLLGSRGKLDPTLDDVFKDVGRGGALDSVYGAPDANDVNVGAELAAHDTPENRRLLHSVLEGLLEMPTTVAGSGAAKYFLGTGSFAGKNKAGVGLMSSGNAWAKTAGWKNADTNRVVGALFADHYGSGEWNGVGGLLTQPKGGFQGYPEAELWDAAYDSGSRSSPFAMTHSERNKDFIGALMSDLEGRGLGPALEVKKPKLSVKITPSVAKKALLAHCEAQWDAAIVAWNKERPEHKLDGKAADQAAYVWDRATATRDGEKEQVQIAGGGYGHFKAILVSSPEGEIKEVHALDLAKLKGRSITKAELKDPARPWLDRV